MNINKKGKNILALMLVIAMMMQMVGPVVAEGLDLGDEAVTGINEQGTEEPLEGEEPGKGRSMKKVKSL